MELPADWFEITRRIAWEVGQRRFPGTQLAQDLCEEAPSHIWEKISTFRPAKGSFPAWCYRLVDNLAIDLLRQRQRRRPVDGPTGAPPDGQPQPWLRVEDPRWRKEQQAVETRLDAQQGFAPQDLERLQTVPVLRRVIALAVVGWSGAVPPDLWHKWLEDAKIDPPFPPPDCSPKNGLRPNVRLVAEALEDSEDNVRAHFYRSLPVLRGLDYGRNRL